MLRDTLLRGVAAGLALAGSIALAGCVPGGVTPDGKHVFFETDSQYSDQDTDHSQDVYERSGGKTTLISIGQGDRGNEAFDAQFLAASSDGSDVLFSTTEEMAGSDDDGGLRDVYRRSGNTTTLISDGDDEDPADAFFDDASPDGSRVFFTTGQALSDDDADSGAPDLYMRKGSQTTLISDGADGSFAAGYRGLAASGRAVFFVTQDALTGDDEDGTDMDLFAWREGDVDLISTGPLDGPSEEVIFSFDTASPDGKTVLFDTPNALVDADEDAAEDVYQRKGNTTKLLTPGDASDNINFQGSSIDLRRVFIGTQAQLVDDDDDAARDIYSVKGGEYTLISTGPVPGDQAQSASFEGASASGGLAVFETAGKMTEDDADSGAADVYLRGGGKTKLVSQGPAGTGTGNPASFVGMSVNGSMIFFETEEALVGADEDSAIDVYQRSGNKTAQVSRGKGGTGNGDFDAGFAFSSDSGAHAFFYTGEQLLPADGDPSGECTDDDDPACDGYERFRNKTKLVTRGN